MSGRPYDDVGRAPMTDADLDAAIAAWDSDHPDQPGGPMRSRLRRLNAEAKERAEAEAAEADVQRLVDEAVEAGFDTTPEAIRQAIAGRKARVAAERRRRQAEAARRIIGDGRGVPSTDALGIIGLSEADVLAARRRWQLGGGHPWVEAGCSKSTYLRWRHHYDLVPWPEAYRDKLTP